MEKEKSDIAAIYLSVINFMVLFYGLKLAAEEYLFEDELPFSWILLIAFLSGIIVAVIAYFFNSKSKKIQIIIAAAILILMILVNLYLRYI